MHRDDDALETWPTLQDLVDPYGVNTPPMPGRPPSLTLRVLCAVGGLSVLLGLAWLVVGAVQQPVQFDTMPFLRAVPLTAPLVAAYEMARAIR